MAVTVTFPVISDRAAFIRAGHDPEISSIAVDLETIDQNGRALLADYDTHRLTAIKVTAPTAEALVDALQRRADEKKATDAEREELVKNALEKMLDHYRKKISQRKADELRKPVHVDAPEEGWYIHKTANLSGPADMSKAQHLCHDDSTAAREVIQRAEATVAEWPELKAWENELHKENEAARAKAKAEAEQQKELKKAKADELRAWGVDHGSQRVRLLIEEDHIAWKTITEDEFLDQQTPAGYAPVPVPVRDRTKPKAADLLALREARTLAEASNGVLTEPRMGWIVTYRTPSEGDADWDDRDADGEVPDRKYAAIGITVTTPTGKTRDVWHEVTDDDTH